MNFWQAFADELNKLAVESASLENVATSGEHKAALDTNDERGSKPTKAEEKDKVTSMSMAKAKNGGKVMKKVAAFAELTATEAAKLKKKGLLGKRMGKEDAAAHWKARAAMIRKAMEEKEEMVCKTPGRKIRSKGKGRGLGIGNGRGPIGRMKED